MFMKISSSLRKKLFFIFAFVLVTIIPLALTIQSKPQDTRSRAQKTARLFMNPDSSATNPIRKNTGETFSVDLMIDPGQNSVSFVKFELLYDASKLSVANAQSVAVNTQAFPSILEGPVLQSGRIAALVSIGSDPTKGVNTITKVATITFSATAETASPVTLSFGPISQVLSLSANAQATEDVLSTTSPAYVQVGQGSLTITPTISGTVTTNPSVTGIVPTSTIAPTPIGGCNPIAGTLVGSQEVPPTNSQESATIRINFTSDSSANVTINSSIQNRVTAVHIHSPAAPGVNAPPTVTLYTGGPLDVFPNEFLTTATIPANVVKDIKDGVAYVNIHTDQFPDGEIRGQLVCASTTPVPSIDPRNTRLFMTIALHGIGSSGDNPNPRTSTLSTKNPNNPDRPISVQVLNSSNQIIVTRLAQVKYDQGKGVFTGLVDLGIGLTEGNYVIKVKSDRYLRKLLPGFYALSPGKEFGVREIDLVAGDINDDNVINVLDYNILYDCGYGAFNPQPMTSQASKFQQQACQSHTFKANADLNDNGIVSSNDYNLFIRELSVQMGE